MPASQKPLDKDPAPQDSSLMNHQRSGFYIVKNNRRHLSQNEEPQSPEQREWVDVNACPAFES